MPLPGEFTQSICRFVCLVADLAENPLQVGIKFVGSGEGELRVCCVAVSEAEHEIDLMMPEDQQVIVLENKEPPASVLPRLRQTHFSGTAEMGGAGFIPKRERGLDSM